MQKNANETAKETKNMFLQSAKELKAVTAQLFDKYVGSYPH